MTGDWQAPDGIEPVVGWRYWGLDAGWLTSINRFSTWPARRATRARCAVAAAHDGVIPHEDCTCGVYAVRALDVLREVTDPIESAPEGQPRTVVVGTVGIWGRVVPGEWGWRGERAYPRELWVVAETVREEDPSEAAAAVADRYGVPVATCDAAWALPPEARPPEDATTAETMAMAAGAWDLSHSLGRLAAAAARGGSAYEEELRRFFRRAGLDARRPGDGRGS